MCRAHRPQQQVGENAVPAGRKVQAVGRGSGSEQHFGELAARDQTHGVSVSQSALQSSEFVTAGNGRHGQLKHHQRPIRFRRTEPNQQPIQVRFDLT